MPVQISIQAVPNQTFSVQQDDQNYDITLKATRGVMSASISINNVVVVSNSRFFADTPLIPYEYQEGAGGNFIFTVEGDDIPIYTEFDVTQSLFYLSAAEVADAR